MATDARLRAALAGLDDVGSVIISQRVASIRACDLILVLHHGQLVGLGSHEQLMRSCEHYQEIAHSQLMGEEVSA